MKSIRNNPLNQVSWYTINYKDLDNVINEGINLGMPVIFYSKGILNKKGREFLSKKSTFIRFKRL